MSRKADRQARMAAERDERDAKADRTFWSRKAVDARGESRRTFQRGVDRARSRADDARRRQGR